MSLLTLKKPLFVTEDRVAYPLVEAVRLAQKGDLPSVYVVQGKGGSFIRTKPPVPKDQELEYLSISTPELFSFIQGTGHAKSTRAHSYTYIIQPKYSIFFAAAFIRFVIDFWSSHSDLSNRSEIIGTLYHRGYGEPKQSPQSNARGEQIANEFFPPAKSWLTEV